LAIQDALGNAVHTALAFDVQGEDVLVTGAGPIGIMAVPILRMTGARRIVVTDVKPLRLALAKAMGADVTLDVRHNKIESVFEKLGMTEGFDVGLEMSGNEQALADMVDNMANGGKIAILGIFPDVSKIKIDWNKVIFRGLTLKGIYGREIFSTWYKMTALLRSGLADKVEKIITHEFYYTDFEAAFEAMVSGEAVKVVLNFD
jgi:threonine 3-dehydrogenase